MNARPESGLTMKRWAVAGLASIGMAWLACSRRARAEARPRGFRVRRAPEASASYSRERDEVRRLIALVAHETQLYDDLSAAENLAFTSVLGGSPVQGPRLRDVLARVGLEAHADTRVRALSSGMRRRVALARAMLRAPRVLLLDEPFSGLDGDGVKRLDDYLHGFRAKGGAGVVVTHSLGRAMAVADEVVVLSGGRLAGRLAGADLTEAALERLYLAASETE